MTLFDFFESRPKSENFIGLSDNRRFACLVMPTKPAAPAKTQKVDSKPSQGPSAPNSSRISSAVQVIPLLANETRLLIG